MTTSLMPDIIGTIAQKLANQIIAFQQSIEARPEGQQFPTPQEANQQHKLITCLLRLVKQPAKPRREQAPDSDDAAALASWTKMANEVFASPATSSTPAPPPINKIAVQKHESAIITQRDFEQYGHQLKKGIFANLTDKTTIKFNGNYVNAKWLEYNLMQYCLPQEQRHFLDEPGHVITPADYNATREKIRDLLEKRKAA